MNHRATARAYVQYCVDDSLNERQISEIPDPDTNVTYVGFIAGPEPTFVAVWSYLGVKLSNREAAELARDLLMGPQFRCYTNDDVVGVEMGGALKNVIAIGAGLADGLAAGDNAKAAFLTRGIAEIARLGVAVGARPLTFAGLTGLGDLIATCASPLSRNRRVGQELAKGRSLAEIRATMTQVAEGVFTTEAARELGRRAGVELPITEQVYEIMFGGKPPLRALADLMRRDAKDELEGLRAIPYPPAPQHKDA